jgi:N-acetylglucosaminyldiphosphoundecaprenol N-acetyl-beta-D-mannosaminyltransferase
MTTAVAARPRMAFPSRAFLPTVALAALIVWLPLQTPVTLLLHQYAGLPAGPARALLLLKDAAVVGLLLAFLPLARASFRWSLPDTLAAGYAGVVVLYTFIPRPAWEQLPPMAVLTGLRELLLPVELYALGRLAATAGADRGVLARLVIGIGFVVALAAVVGVALVPASFWATTIDMPRFIREVQGVLSATTLRSVSIVATYGEGELFARAIGPFTHPVSTAHYLVLPLALTTALAAARAQAAPRAARALVAIGVVVVVAIVATISRGAWVAAAIAVLAIAFRTCRLRLGVAGVAAAGAIVALVPPYRHALWSAASGADPSTRGHGQTIVDAVGVLSEHPFGLGVGHGGYFGSAFGADVGAASETLYLTLAVAAGPAAVALFVGWLAVLVGRLVWQRPAAGAQRTADDWVMVAVGAATLGLAAVAVLSSPWLRFTPAATFWMFLGLVATNASSARTVARPADGTGNAGPAPAHGRHEVGGIPFDEMNQRQAVDWIVRRAAEANGGYVCTPNVDYVVRARRDAAFRAAVLGATLRLPDGKGVIYGSILAGRRLRGGVTGRLLPESVAPRLAADRRTVALFGAGPGIAERAAETVRRGGGVVADAFGPGTPFVVGSEEDVAAVERLRAAGAAVIFCALGAPIQELWMARHHRALAPAVLVGVGAAFDVMSGKSAPPPRWMTDVGLEWLFRLVHDPRRLARRYLWDDPRFFWWMVQARVGGRRG